MNPRFSRRTFSRATLAAPAAMLMGSSKTNAQLVMAPTASDAVIGGTRDAFDAAFGTPRQEADFYVYDFSHNQQATYWVRFDTNGHAEYIEIDFTALPGGGLEFSRDVLGESQFLPSDSGAIGAGGSMGILQSSRSAFYSYVHRSEWVSAYTGRSVFPIVVDEFRMSDDGWFTPSPIQRSFVSMETYEVHPVVATGKNPGIVQPVDDWRARYGQLDATRGGFEVRNPPIPGRWILGNLGDGQAAVTQIDASFDTPISTIEAAAWVGSMVKETGRLVCTYWLPPTPNGSVGLRIHVFGTYRYEYATSIQYVTGTEQNGTVDRIMFVHTYQYRKEGF